MIIESVFTQVLVFTEELISLHINSDAVTSKNTLTRAIFPTVVWIALDLALFALDIKCQTKAPSLLLSLENQGSYCLTVGSLIHCLSSCWRVKAFILPSFYTFSFLHLFFLVIWYFVIWKLNDTLISSTNGKLSTWNLVNLKEVKCCFWQCICLEIFCQYYIFSFTSLNCIFFLHC